VLGSVLLLAGPGEVFSRVVPWLILFSCAVLAAQPAVGRWLRSRSPGDPGRDGVPVALLTTQLLAAVYGAYFGAGLGVLTLALLGIFVDDGLQRLNALKGLLSLVINLVAVLCFLASGRVAWAAVAIMAVASLLGGRAGVTMARRLDDRVLRGLVIAFGAAVAIRLLL
jgi:uncharacterized membrane protein YfcA